MIALTRLAVRAQIVAFLATLAMAGPARAAAIYDALVSSTLTIESIANLTSPGTTGDLQIDGEAVVFDSDSSAFEDAAADADGSVSPAVSTPLGIGDGKEKEQEAKFSWNILIQIFYTDFWWNGNFDTCFTKN